MDHSPIKLTFYGGAGTVTGSKTLIEANNKKILIAKMSGNGIAIIDVASRKYLGTIVGASANLRHLRP